MAGALCRCMTYYRVQAAIKRASNSAAARSRVRKRHADIRKREGGEEQ